MDVLVIEDCGKADKIEEVGRVCRDNGAIFVGNERNLGQIQSIDRAYQSLTAKYKYVFHIEDDWKFIRGGFVHESVSILNTDPRVSAVIGTDVAQFQWINNIVSNLEESEVGNTKYIFCPPDAHPVWFGFSFNPGLRRLSDYRAAGSYSKWGTERDMSIWFKRRGMGIAYLVKPFCVHIGGDCGTGFKGKKGWLRRRQRLRSRIDSLMLLLKTLR